MESRKALWLFITVTLFITINDRLLFVLLPTYFIDKNFTATQIGLIFSFAALILVLMRSVIGRMSDKYGRKFVMSAGLVLDAITSAFYPVVSKIHEFAVVMGLQEVANTLERSVEDSIHADAFPEKERPKYLIKMGKAFPVSRAIAAILGIIVTTYLSIVYGFYIAAVSAFIAFLVFAAFFRESPKTEKRAKFKARYSRKILPIALAGFLGSVTFGLVYSPAFFILGEKYLGVEANTIFLLLLASYIVSAVGIHIAEKKTKNLGKKNVAILAAVLFALFSFLYSTQEIVFFVISLMGIAVTYYFWRISYKTILMDRSDRSSRGAQLGFVKTLEGIGDIAGPALGGFLIDIFSIQMPFIAAGVIYLAMSVLILKYI